MHNQTSTTPITQCAFHPDHPITYFCKYHQCLLPLCKQCLPIHRKQHTSKHSPIDLVTIQEATLHVSSSVHQQISTLQQMHINIINRTKISNQQHSHVKQQLLKQRDNCIQTIVRYYQSLCRQIDHNFQRRQVWLRQLVQMHQNVLQELSTIQHRLQTQKHLRSIIMWNKLNPPQIVQEIVRQTSKEFEPPVYVPGDIQKTVNVLAESQKLRVLDLHGDMGLGKLSKTLHVLRFGQETQSSVLSNTQARLSVTSPSRRSKLLISRSIQRL